VLPTVEHIDAIKRLAPNTLIDVGANKGQFSTIARYLFPEIEIHAFEPLESECRYFESVVSQPVKLYSTAVGATPGRAEFFVTSRADSSSLFKPGVGQESAYGVVCASSITVPVARLSDIVDMSKLRRPILMKLDIQGGELDALQGAQDMLPYVDYIYCETSYVPLYDGQPLANELASYLIAQGFSLVGVYNQSVTKEYGATQADFLWARRN
jgi:FkbM family methyltransferase